MSDEDRAMQEEYVDAIMERIDWFNRGYEPVRQAFVDAIQRVVDRIEEEERERLERS